MNSNLIRRFTDFFKPKTENQKLINLLLKRWDVPLYDSPDETEAAVLRFRANFEQWINGFHNEDKTIILALLENFRYYQQKTINKFFKDSHKKLLTNFFTLPNNTIYSYFTKRNGETNSSHAYILNYATVNDIGYSCVAAPSALNSKMPDTIKNIVFTDDCCGTGMTFMDSIIKAEDFYKTRKIFYIVVHLLSDAEKNIESFKNEHNFDITILSLEKRDKAFKSDFFTNNFSYKKLFIRFCEKTGIPREDILGFLETEALAAFFNNTPNNTLGAFRYELENFKPPFLRKPPPPWRGLNGIKIGRENRSKETYYAKKHLAEPVK